MLVRAGYRGQASYVTYLFFRLVLPPVMATATLMYLFLVMKSNQPAMVKIGIGIAAAYVGVHVPYLY
jgi:tight adherence protein C